MDIRSLSGPMELSDILDTPSPLIRVNACMYEYMPHMYIFVTALSNIPLIMLCMFPHGLYSILDYEINLSYLILSSKIHACEPLVRSVKALTRLRACAVSPEHSLLAYAISIKIS